MFTPVVACAPVRIGRISADWSGLVVQRTQTGRNDMKLSIRRVIATSAVSIAAALLVLAPTLSAELPANSVSSPSASGGAESAPPAAETAKPAAPKAANAKKNKKKKSSFINKIRDKAAQQVQKLLDSKQEPKQQ